MKIRVCGAAESAEDFVGRLRAEVGLPVRYKPSLFGTARFYAGPYAFGVRTDGKVECGFHGEIVAVVACGEEVDFGGLLPPAEATTEA